MRELIDALEKIKGLIHNDSLGAAREIAKSALEGAEYTGPWLVGDVWETGHAEPQRWVVRGRSPQGWGILKMVHPVVSRDSTQKEVPDGWKNITEPCGGVTMFHDPRRAEFVSRADPLPREQDTGYPTPWEVGPASSKDSACVIWAADGSVVVRMPDGGSDVILAERIVDAVNRMGEAVAMEGHMYTTNILSCARCGEDHPDVTFFPFTNKPQPDTTHYAECPKTKEPILLVVEKTEGHAG